MFEDFECRGVWWLPGKSRKKVPGQLTFSAEAGATLELMGPFADDLLFEGPNRYEMILGQRLDLTPITLRDCWVTFRSYNDRAISADTVVVGVHIRNINSFRFDNLRVRFFHVHEWCNYRSLDVQRLGQSGMSVTYQTPESLVAKVATTPPMSIEIEPGADVVHDLFEGIRISPLTWIVIRPDKPMTLPAYEAVLLRLQQFFSLAASRPVFPLRIEATTDVNKREIDGQEFHPPVLIMYGVQFLPKSEKQRHAHHMLFSLGDVADQFEAVMNNWFGKADVLEPIYDLYSGAVYNRNLYWQNQFLGYVQALESYHRRTRKQTEDELKEHKEKVAEIVEAVHERHKKWLGERLLYSHEPNLRRRLKDILAEFPGAVDKFIGDKRGFIHKVHTTRNYLTHYDTSLKDSTPDVQEVYKLITRMKLLTEMCLLSAIGFPHEQVSEIVGRALQRNPYRVG